MGVLTSKLFTTADRATVNKLEDCATGQPSETQSHFALGQSGEHIRKAQEALKSVQEADPSLGIPAFSVNGSYDSRFAEAIRIYKTKRNIRNFANKIDNIVGVKTIRSLDQENKSGPPKVNPSPAPAPKRPGEFPRPLPNCVPDSDCPTSTEFDVTLIAGGTAGEVVEGGEFFFAIRDTTNGLSAPYILRTGGVGFGSPVGLALGGGKKHFQTSNPVRVTRFGPAGTIRSATSVPGSPLNFTLLVLTFRPDGLLPRPSPTMFIDTGPIEVPGVGFDVGQLKILSVCSGQAGASRRILNFRDFPA